MTRRFCFLLLATVLLLLPAASFPQSAPAPINQVRIPPPPPNASPQQLEQRGDELRAEKAYFDARDYYAAALKKSPVADRHHAAELYNKIGIVELEAQNFGIATKAFKRSIKLDKLYAEPYNNLGATFYLLKKPKAAIKQYGKALKLNDQNASFHANLGTAYLTRKQFDLMNVEFARAVELDPNIFEHRSNTGSALQLRSPLERARFDYALAKVYAKYGNADLSLRYLRMAMEDGYQPIGDVYKDAAFVRIRKDPRFTALMASPPVAIRGHQ